MENPKIMQYVFPRNGLPGAGEIFKEDEGTLNALSSRLGRGMLRRIPETDEWAVSARDIFDEYNSQIVGDQNVQNTSELERIANIAKQSTTAYWDVSTEFPIQIVHYSDMLTAEIEYKERLLKEGILTDNPVVPSPDFVDFLEGKLVLSDRYIASQVSHITDTAIHTRDLPDTYGWNEENLQTFVADSIGQLAIRSLRGELGDNFTRMIRDVNDATDFINHTNGYAGLYSLPRIIEQGGLPLLQLRLLRIFMQPGDQRGYGAVKALGDDIGIHNAALFDGVTAFGIEDQGKNYEMVVGELWTAHPNHERKYHLISDAVQKLTYQVATRGTNETVTQTLQSFERL